MVSGLLADRGEVGTSLREPVPVGQQPGHSRPVRRAGHNDPVAGRPGGSSRTGAGDQGPVTGDDELAVHSAPHAVGDISHFSAERASWLARYSANQFALRLLIS